MRWRRSLRPAPGVRHGAFLSRLRHRRRTASRVGLVARSLRRTPTFAASWHAAFTLVTATRTSVFVPGAPLGPPAANTFRTERLFVQRDRHTHERRDTHVLERVRSILVQTPASSRTYAAEETRPAVRRTPHRPDLSRMVMTMVRAPETIAAVRPDPAASDTTQRGKSGSTNPPHFVAAEGVSLPPQELSRVTEHVLRTLDRRVLSHRERSGQT
jgi:hypothetical protein